MASLFTTETGNELSQPKLEFTSLHYLATLPKEGSCIWPGCTLEMHTRGDHLRRKEGQTNLPTFLYPRAGALLSLD